MNGQERRQLRLEDVVKHDTLIHSIGFNPTDYQLSLDLDWYHGSGAMTRSPSPLAWRPDFPGAPREAH